ncbi:MAG: hypothetical protein QXD04_02025 [Candidatus Bathyarchaeia archaeon]
MEKTDREYSIHQKIATAILVAITLTAAAAFGYWLGGIVSLIIPP